jgi:hypothetical protein
MGCMFIHKKYNMKKFAILVLSFSLITSISAQTLGGLLKKAEDALGGDVNLSQEDIGNGLKEALNEGVGKAVEFLSAEDGYFKSPYKILLPEEAQQVVKKVKMVPGFENVEDELVERLNRAAELAAAKAKPIFVSAIKQMTFKDAMDILMGEKDAATQYLEKTTSQQLFDEFMPVIQNSLDEVNAREYWRSVVQTYNKLPFVKKVNPELDEYVTTKGLDGMYALIQKKELDIRKNQSSRTSDLLTKVFAKQD